MQIILVDKKDNPLGTIEKIEAHKKGLLHRAFSVFIFNKDDKLLLQRRAMSKYHSPGLWTNTCCSHPWNEDTKKCAMQRLKEEMGIECDIEEKFSFIYKKSFDNGLTEYEFDHVFFGKYDKDPLLNEDEAMDYRWVDIDGIIKDIEKNPEKYTYWLKECIYRVKKIYFEDYR